MQGKKNTLWIGASASFESVHDVGNNNLQILDNHFGGDFHGDREQLYMSNLHLSEYTSLISSGYGDIAERFDE